MGFKKSLNSEDIISQIQSTASEIRSPYNDGFVSWALKQDLYKLQFFLDDVIKNLPEFPEEAEFLDELSKIKIYRILKK
jgi:hypothetical protein